MTPSRNVGRAVRMLLQRHVGLSPATIGNMAYEEAIASRLKATSLALDVWYARLQQDSTELDALTEAMVIPETWFFRDETPFVEAARHALRRAPDASHPFRVLCLPCATGEEAYSVAIALQENGLRPAQFRVEGIDISAAALARAHAAIYRSASFRSPRAEATRSTWFVQSGDTFALIPGARESVHFRRGNAMVSDTLAGAATYDVIFCRNLLIYLDLAARKALVARLRARLSPGGLLFVGHAESLLGFDQGLRRLADPRAFGYERILEDSAPAPLIETRKPSARTRSRPQTITPGKPPSEGPRRTRPPSQAVAAPLPPQNPLDAARALADRGELTEARILVTQSLKTPTAAAFHLLGVIAQSESRLDEAEQCFTKALYLDAAHYSSLMHMTLLRERRGDPAAAQFRARAGRVEHGGGKS